MHPDIQQVSTQQACGQWMDFTKALHKRFKLSDAEKKSIYDYVKYASQDLSAMNTVYSGWQGLAKWGGRSLRDYAYQVLNDKGKSVLEEHYASTNPIPSVVSKVAKVAAFILDYLVTLDAMCHSQLVRKISDAYWQRHDLHEITLDEILDRVPFGGEGNRLGEPELLYVISMIRREISLLGRQRAELDRVAIRDSEQSFERQVDERIVTITRIIDNIDPRRCSQPTQYYYTHLQGMRKLRYQIKEAIEGVNG